MFTTRWSPSLAPLVLAGSITLLLPAPARAGRIQPQLGIFNVTNEATVLSQNNSFGPTLDQVQSILDGRVVRLSVQIDF